MDIYPSELLFVVDALRTVRYVASSPSGGVTTSHRSLEHLGFLQVTYTSQ